MIKIKVEKKVNGEWTTKRKFLESCEIENLSWMKNGNKCIRFICPLCKKGTTFPNGKYYHPLDIWEHLDHHPGVEVKVTWKVMDREDMNLFEEIEEINPVIEEE